MSINVDMPDIARAINEDSWEWLQDNHPALAKALAAEVGRGRTPAQIERFVLDNVGPHRSALSDRCRQAAAYLASGEELEA